MTKQAATAAERINKKLDPEQRAEVREQLLAEMEPALKVWYDSVSTRLTTQSRSALQDYWSLGQEATDIQSNNDLEPNAIDRVGFCLGEERGSSVINKAIQFRAKFNQDDLHVLLELKMGGTKRALGWSHVVAVLAVKDHRKRMKLLERAAEQGLTYAELVKEVEKLRPAAETPHAGGRKHKVPRTVEAMSQNMQHHVDPLLKKFDDVYNNDVNNIHQLVQNVDPSSYRPEHVQELQVLRNKTEQLRDAAEKQLNFLDAAERRIQHVLNQQATASEAETSNNGRSRRRARRPVGASA